MSATEAPDWRRTSPLAAVFYLGRIYQAIAKNAWQSLAPLAAFVVAYQGDRLRAAIFGIAVLVGASLVHAALRYWFFRYRLTPDSILIRDGVFRKRQLDIRFERVQGINTTQNIVFRLFRLVTVNLDTAGASGQEGHLPAVGHQLADDLRERIRRTPRRDAIASENETAPAVGTEDGQRLLRLPFGEVVRVGVSSGRVFLALVLIGPLLDQLDDRLEQVAEREAVLRFFGGAAPSLGTVLALTFAVVIGVLLLLVAASIVGAVLRWHGYTLTADGDVLRSESGLLTRHEQSVQLVKVQSLHVIQNLVLRLFRRHRLRTRQATSGRARAASRFDVPICPTDVTPRIAAALFTDELGLLPLDPRAPGFAPVSAAYVRSRSLAYGVLPAAVGAALLAFAAGWAALLALLWVPPVVAAARQRWKRFGVAVTADAMAFRRGFLGARVVAWLHRKVQRVDLVQSPLQRRRGLATMHVHLAGGTTVTVPFVEYAAAARLRDYVLFRVETSDRAWH